MSKNKKLTIIFFVIFFMTIGFSIARNFFAKEPVPVVTSSNILLTISDLKKFDGTDSSQPVYLAYEGNIYDVSEGRSYYAPNGAYHWLTGKDATNDLNLVGGDIIKKKYPIVGKIL
jgi:predicted heme/steroid binding protein